MKNIYVKIKDTHTNKNAFMCFLGKTDLREYANDLLSKTNEPMARHSHTVTEILGKLYGNTHAGFFSPIFYRVKRAEYPKS